MEEDGGVSLRPAEDLVHEQGQDGCGILVLFQTVVGLILGWLWNIGIIPGMSWPYSRMAGKEEKNRIYSDTNR